MGLVLEEACDEERRGERCPIIRIIDDSFPAYDRERLIGRNGVKSLARRAAARRFVIVDRRRIDRSSRRHASFHPLPRARARFRGGKILGHPSLLRLFFAGGVIRASGFVTFGSRRTAFPSAGKAAEFTIMVCIRDGG